MTLHVIPVDDEMVHQAKVGCECCPRVETGETDPENGGRPYASGGRQVIHRSYDCREVVENLAGCMLAEGKGWILVEETEDGGMIIPVEDDEA